jgi:hypothetical protein
MTIFNKKVFSAILSAVFFSSASNAMSSNEIMDLDVRAPHSVPAHIIEAVEQNKQRLLSDFSDEEKLRFSQYPYGVDVYGRRPGDKNYGAYDSDEMIETLRSNGAREITWGVVNFETLSSSEKEDYMTHINYTEFGKE